MTEEAVTFLWTTPEDYPEELIGEYQRERSGDRFLMRRGEPLSDKFKTPVVCFPCPAPRLESIDDLVNTALTPLVSRRVQDILRAVCPADVQLVAAKVFASDNREVPDFKFVVATKVVAGTDLRGSEYHLVPGTTEIMGFTKLRLRPNTLPPDIHLARDSEYPANLLLSGELRRALLEAGCRVTLVRAEDMTW